MSTNHPGRLIAAPLLAALLSGCSLAPVHERPGLPVAADWPASAASEVQNPGKGGAHELAWQDFFQDAHLKRVIALALEHNRDLRVAILNIERARALYQVQSADRLPTLGAGLDGARQRVPDAVSPGGNGGVGARYTASLGVSAFELDLFGRVRKLSEAALARFAATEEAQRALQISLVAEVASVYETVLADQRLVELSKRTVASRTESHERQQQLHQQGAISVYELRQSESLLEAAHASLAQQTRQRAQDENALVALVGQAVSVDMAPAPQARQPLPDIPAGLPSELIAARPDIRAREALLRAASADIGAARAAFFPRITLTGLLGSSSAELSGLFESGTRTWSFLPQVTLPLFDGGRNRARLSIARTDRDIAVAQYDKAIQVAFREVSDALAGRATLHDELRAVRAQEAAEAARLDLAKLRYDNGQSSYLEYLDAQRSVFTAQQQTIRSGLQEVQNRIALYKALGGGWLAPKPG